MIPTGKYKNGDRKPSWRKGKKIAIYMDGKWEHFGDSSMQDYRTHKSEKRRENYNARHAKNMQGNSSRAKAFREYNRITWQDGGEIPIAQRGIHINKDGSEMLTEVKTSDFTQEPSYKAKSKINQGYSSPATKFLDNVYNKFNENVPNPIINYALGTVTGINNYNNLSNDLKERMRERDNTGKTSIKNLVKGSFNTVLSLPFVPTKSVIEGYKQKTALQETAKQLLKNEILGKIVNSNSNPINVINSRIKDYKQGGEFNTTPHKSQLGYKDNSPYKNNQSNDIQSPTGKITMDNVSVPLIVKDLDYNEQRILKPNSGVHQFKGNRFRETKLGNSNEYKKGGYLKDKNTYVTKDGKETRRGLWANVYLKNK